MRWPRGARAVAALVVGVMLVALPACAGGPPAGPSAAPFTGLGAWVDVFDYAPAFVSPPGPPAVVPQSVADLAALGVRTLYLQATIDDPRAAGLIADPALVAQFLRDAHAHGMRVVGWYYPQLVDPTRDEARLDAIVRYRTHGQRFDGVALDIESEQVADVPTRNQRLVGVTRQVHALDPSLPLGAIVYPADLLELVNPRLWPAFPYRALARSVTVWLPMTYWTLRSGVLRDAFAYTTTSVRRLRADLGDPHARVAPVGGLSGASTPADYEGFAKAVRVDRAIGWSVFDAAGTATTAWPYLRDR